MVNLKILNLTELYNQEHRGLIKNFDGTMLSLVQGASGNNYFHFLFDIITKLKLCALISFNEIDFFYVPECNGK